MRRAPTPLGVGLVSSGQLKEGAAMVRSGGARMANARGKCASRFVELLEMEIFYAMKFGGSHILFSVK
jgi:hypothetical protein